MSEVKPNFFIVGAPKCGTTAMDDYLSVHPEIFMATKEQHFFGKDLGYTITRTNKEAYQKSFEGSGNKKIIGEASVWYLFSKTAASEIKEFSPDAKILIMLRNPVDMVYSLHSQNIYDCNEDVLSFEEALSKEPQRKNKTDIPESSSFIDCLLYTEAGSFTHQVKRYIDVFGKENVMVIIYDDFKKDTATQYKKVLDFLGVDNSFKPDFSIVNSNKIFKNPGLHKLIKSPSEKQKRFVRKLFPFKSLRLKAMEFFYNKNIRKEERKKMLEVTRTKLISVFAEDVKKLSILINRDLNNWMQ